MADISQITLPDGTTYDIKDPVARAAAGDAGAGKIFYGVCSTAAATQTKVVTIDDFELFTGALIAVKFDNVNTATAPKLNISGTGAINMYSVGTTAVLPNTWSAGETLLFVYNGTSYMVADGGIASTSGYGATKLNSATDSTSTTEAATPSAVKSAYDLALEAKTSASDGKTLIASAITGKGVSTSATDTFSTMASNISSIQTGHTITIDGEGYDDDINLSTGYGYWIPTTITSSPRVVGLSSCYIQSKNVCTYNDKVYLLGCGYSSGSYKRYVDVFDGSSWSSATTLPSDVGDPATCVYNGVIHIIRQANTSTTNSGLYHYTYDGSAFTNLGTDSITIPDGYTYYGSRLFNVFVFGGHLTIAFTVYNSDGIACLMLFQYNNNNWSSISTGFIPSSKDVGDFVCFLPFHNYIYGIMGNNSNRYLYRFNNGSWFLASSNLPVGLRGWKFGRDDFGGIVYDDNLYIFGSYYSYLSGAVYKGVNDYLYGNRIYNGQKMSSALGSISASDRGSFYFIFNDQLWNTGTSYTSSTNYYYNAYYQKSYI